MFSSYFLVRFIAQFTREFIYQVEHKALSYTDGFHLISAAAEIFFIQYCCHGAHSKNLSVLDLGFDVIHLVVYALVNWPIECEVVSKRHY